MDSIQYSKFLGLDQSLDPIDNTQISFLKCDNWIPNRVFHSLFARGGSQGWAVTGDVWGLGAYAKETGSSKVPVSETIIRHRRTAAITYLEKLSWSSSVWDNITLGSNTAFDISDTTHFAQISELLVIAGGRPAKIRDITSGSAERLGGPAPTAAPLLSSGGTGLTGTFSYVYTFRDSTTGWESSPSPISSAITVANKTITVSGLATSCAREGVDKKRIYRTILTGEQPFLQVQEVALAVTSFDDAVLDAALGATAPEALDHEPPPLNSYLAHAHENRLFIVDADNPTQLYYSKVFDNSYANLEYFSPDRVESFPKRITGLATRPGGGLLIFQPPGFGIYELTGRTESQFTLQVAYPNEGTNFKNSVSTNGSWIAFWSEDGPAFIPSDERETAVSRELSLKTRNFLRSAQLTEYNGNIFIWSQWSNTNKQFIFSFAATDAEAAAWFDEQTGLPVQWIVEGTGEVVDWGIDTISPPPTGGNWFGENWYLGNWYAGTWV